MENPNEKQTNLKERYVRKREGKRKEKHGQSEIC